MHLIVVKFTTRPEWTDQDMPQALASTPKIVSHQVDGSGWEEMGELQVD